MRRGETDDAEVQAAKREFEARQKQYQRMLNEQVELFDQMYVNARQLLNRDDLVIRNEEEIVRIKYEIDLSKLELDQKREMVLELEQRLEQAKGDYKELKVELKRQEKRAEQLQAVLKQKEDELD